MTGTETGAVGHGVLAALAADRAITVVRAPRIDDPAALCDALTAGGIRSVELTYTTPELPRLLREASARASGAAAGGGGAIVGAGTVVTEEQARLALDCGAQFLVTPGMGPEAASVVAAAHEVQAAAVIGALTPSEVITALAIGADAVKIFPARGFGPKYFSDLRGPLPDAPLIPSGGVDADNAASFLRAGALAVTAGTSVVAPTDVAEGRWQVIADKARAFTAALG